MREIVIKESLEEEDLYNSMFRCDSCNDTFKEKDVVLIGILGDRFHKHCAAKVARDILNIVLED